MIESVTALASEQFLNEMHSLMTSSKTNKDEFGELLCLFSSIARHEFGLKDSQYPVLKKDKKWQNPMVYGVLIGIMNEKLKLPQNVNLRNEIFVKGCYNYS